MSAETEMLHVYLTNVWRLLFYCTRYEKGNWGPIIDVAFYNRISQMGVDLGRDLDTDLDAAQQVVDSGGKFPDWIKGQRDVTAPA